MPDSQDRPTPADYQPRVSAWGWTWRLLLTLLISAFGWVPLIGEQSRGLLAIDVTVGLLAYVLAFGWRRRHPLPIAVVVSLLAAVSGIAAGPSVLVAVSVATRRRWREIVVVGCVGFAAAQLLVTWQPSANDADPWWLLLGLNAFGTLAIIAWGLYIGSRRELIWTLRNRAERAESEQALRVAQARTNERARIAREMHDVLAHRISQISMHAGALAFREDLDAASMRESAGVVQAKAHEALTDLRGVLGVLRDGDGELTTAPQPTYADLEALVAEARGSGLAVDYDDRVERDGAETVPDAAGRTVYRIVQEGMTNARKHAPGSRLAIELTGSPEEGLDVVMRNPLGFGSRTPGAGLGLVGLAERAELRGGRLATRVEGDTFVLHGWIPWAA
ncbi:histidine kinase [Nocardioides flavescens]|uniref:histidine kinase n=1 Tax=Nocardioides flavescens TaxID=2691959 RepID=A0A6L7EWI6_9ACTN|nr:histidine kinase [Nocardioides flavescens]